MVTTGGQRPSNPLVKHLVIRVWIKMVGGDISKLGLGGS